MIIRIILLFLAYIPLAAHFLRTGAVLPAIILALLPCLALLRKKSCIVFLQVGLVVGSFAVWLPTIINIAQMRMAMGEPWLRMALILSSVILFTLFSAWFSRGIYIKDKESCIAN